MIRISSTDPQDLAPTLENAGRNLDNLQWAVDNVAEYGTVEIQTGMFRIGRPDGHKDFDIVYPGFGGWKYSEELAGFFGWGLYVRGYDPTKGWDEGVNVRKTGITIRGRVGHGSEGTLPDGARMPRLLTEVSVPKGYEWRMAAQDHEYYDGYIGYIVVQAHDVKLERLRISNFNLAFSITYSGGTIQSCHFARQGWGLYMMGHLEEWYPGEIPRRTAFRNNLVTATQQLPHFEGSYFDIKNNKADLGIVGLVVRPAGHSVVEGNEISFFDLVGQGYAWAAGWPNGIWIQNHSGARSTNIKVRDNRVILPPDAGENINGRGIIIETGDLPSEISGGTIAGNLIEGCRYPIRMIGNLHGIRVVANTLINTYDARWPHAGILVGPVAKSNVFKGNDFSRAGYPGISGQCDPLEAAIYLASGTEANRVGNNLYPADTTVCTQVVSFGTNTIQGGATCPKAPQTLSGSGVEGSLTYPVTLSETGSFAATGRGFAAAQMLPQTVSDDPESSWILTEMEIPPGTLYTRWALYDEYTDAPYQFDLDLYVVGPGGDLVAQSALDSSTEVVSLSDPAAGVYQIWVNGYYTGGKETSYTLFAWQVADAPAENLLVSGPASGKAGQTVTIDTTWSSLAAGTKYLGLVVHATIHCFERTLLQVDTD